MENAGHPRSRTLIAVLTFISGTVSAATADRLEHRCYAAVGKAAATCLRDYSKEVRRCRDKADAECEAALRNPDATLAALLAASQEPIRKSCTDASAERMSSSVGLDALVPYAAEACQKWAEDFLDVAYVDDPGALSADALGCQRQVAGQLDRLRDKVVQAVGPQCDAAEFAGHDCNRGRRDQKIAKARAAARKRIVKRCGAVFDQLGLVDLSAGATLEARVDVVVDRIVVPARHFALRVYPQFNLGPSALNGPAPVGVRTLDLVDPSRQNRTGTGPRPLKVEVYYPSTAAAVAGVPRDVVNVFGIDLFPTPTYRNVDRAPGKFPVVLYSHGSGGVRFESLTLGVHLAGHGYLVVSADHHGDTLGDSGDTRENILSNRPRDLSFLIDQLLAFDAQSGSFFEGAIDATRIGATGHSYGGYTVIALAVGSFSLGTFTDPRVKAVLPLDGSAFEFVPDAPALYTTIHVPIFLLTASLLSNLDNNQEIFDTVASGPSVVALANFLRGGHNSFPDTCEVPEALRGFVAECEPLFLPWRHVRHIEKYLALNFFDATLGGSADALARLAPTMLADIEEIAYQNK